MNMFVVVALLSLSTPSSASVLESERVQDVSKGYAVQETGEQKISLSFAKSVNRLTAPVMLSDVLDVSEQSVTDMQWPETLNGWVTQQQVNDWLQNNDIAPEALAWQGRKKAWLEVCYPIANGSIEPLIKPALEAQLKQSFVSLQSVVLPHTPCADSASYKVELDSLKRLNADKALAKLKVYVDQDGEHKSPDLIDVHIRFTASLQTIELQQKVQQDARILESEYSIVETTWTGREFPLQMLTHEHVFAKSLGKGHRLMSPDIDVQSTVSMGQVVKVKVINGPVVIETKGKVMSNANVGEQVKVKINGSHSLSNATVVAKGEVHVAV